MWVALAGAVALAPCYWLVVPAAARPAFLMLASLAALGALDARLPLLVAATALALAAAARGLPGLGPHARGTAVATGLAALLALFVWNKQAGGTPGALATQGGLALLGVSYLVLKAAAALVELGRDGLARPRARELVGWLAFLPTYPAGPITDLDRFRMQRPAFDRAQLLGGLERILFGAVKALLVAHYVGLWTTDVVAHPGVHGRLALVAGLYGLAIRFYLDFAGMSDIAIGLAAVFGMTVEENFDRPLARRNLVLLWQHWHMTLTGWLRRYLFVPVSRALLRRDPGGRLPIVAAQLVTMGFCGLWHGLAWNFFAWGLVHALGLVWVGLLARDAGALVPAGVRAWWRTSPVAHAASVALTVTAFATSLLLVATDVRGAGRYLGCLLG